LREYDRGVVSFDEVLEAVRDYVKLVGHERYLPYYVATLRDMPWKRCDCAVCRSAGVDVVIFRGNNRNRRRGFHNVYVFSKLLRSGNFEVRFTVPKDGDVKMDETLGNEKLEFLLKNARTVLIVTHCTEEKSVPWEGVVSVLRERGLTVPSHDIEKEALYREVLQNYMKPAKEMYGGSFAVVRSLADVLRRVGKEVDVYIISARYGLISENELIVPYEATLKGRPKEWIRHWSAKLGVENKLLKVLSSKKYDLVIVALPREYAYAVEGVLRKLLRMENAILILPKRAITTDGVKARYILAGNLKSRIRQIALLREIAIKTYTGPKG
jgi:hypothetical protein